MKFSCDRCGAKYQIEDRKIAGRTASMTCRRCGHDVVVQGEPLPASTPPEAVVSSHPPPEERVSSASIPPPVPSTWHVAIDDTPVGPLSREDIAARIAAGRVTGRSLAWREGLEGWRPIAELPGLKELLPPDEAARPSVPPLPRASVPPRSSSPPRPPAPARPSGSPPPVAPLRPSLSPRVSVQSSASARSAAGAAPSNVIPFSSRTSASPRRADETGKRALEAADPAKAPEPTPLPPEALPAADLPPASASDAPSSEPAAVHPPAAPPVEVAAEPSVSASRASSLPPLPAKPAWPLGAWIAIVAVACSGITLGLVLGRPFAADPPPVSPPPPPEAAPPTPERRMAEPELVIDSPEEAPAPAPIEEPSDASSTTRRRSRRASRIAKTEAEPSRPLTAADRAMLDRFSGGTAANPTGLSVPSSSKADGDARGEGLNAQQLTSVVGKNRPQLQRCYESAIRGMVAAPAVRMDVDLSVGSSGAVSTVSVRGPNVGTLSSCIEQTVRKWRFPTSGASTQTSFPVVFQPGG